MENYHPSYESQIEKLMRAPRYRPLRQKELADALNIPPESRREFRAVLREMELAGKVLRLRKNRFVAATPAETVRGQIRFANDGFAMLESSEDKEVFFIPKGMTGCALHLDEVEAELLEIPSGKKRGRMDRELKREARVTRVVKRNFSDVVGLLMHTKWYSYVVPDNPKLTADIRVRSSKIRPDEFHKVIVRLDEWNDPAVPLSGEIIEDIGHRDAPGVAMQCIIRSHGYEQEFPETVMKEVRKLHTERNDISLEGRIDLRDEMIFTIDPESARDFDDAVSIAAHPDGGWAVGVHIAAVAEWVKPGSAIDKEALRRGNSVYLVDRVIMMLPKELTAEVCSLSPNRDAYAHTVELHLSESGKVKSCKTYRSVIHSKARLSYKQVQSFFDGEREHGIPAEVVERLDLLRPLARRLRQDRFANGSVDIEMPQVNCILGPDGKVARIERSTAKEAYALIEELMLLANKAVAEKILAAAMPSLYRIHEEPEPEQWAKMAEELQALGIPETPLTRGDINRIIQGIPEGPLKFAATLSMLRNFKRAEYAAECSPHFGLAFERYTHFTSPIRRYPDLQIHRILAALEEGHPAPFPKKRLAEIAVHCSETEREAEEAEKESVEMKRIEFYNDRLLAGEIGPYSGTVVKIIRRGMIVELNESLQCGMVAFADLHDDYYQVNETGTRATGERGSKGWTIGDVLEVELVKVDLTRRLVDFRVAGTPERKNNRKHQQGPRPKKPGSYYKKKYGRKKRRR